LVHVLFLAHATAVADASNPPRQRRAVVVRLRFATSQQMHDL
jgi:hypothetical protein